MLDFTGKVAVVTGGARGIGKCIAEQFAAAGATVAVIDLLDNGYFVGDLADKATLERFAKKVVDDFGRVDFLIHNAAPRSCGSTPRACIPRPRAPTRSTPASPPPSPPAPSK